MVSSGIVAVSVLMVVVVKAATAANEQASQPLDCGRRTSTSTVGCLDVYSSYPSNLPKCYCTQLCPSGNRLETLTGRCASGELHADGCGSCLVCSKAINEACGGPYNMFGTCGAGLNCLIRIPSSVTTADRKQFIRTAAGVCVDDASEECPTSTRKVPTADCRPGKQGIPDEALYCPTGLPVPKSTQTLPTLQGLLTKTR